MQRQSESYSDPKNQYLFKLVNMMDTAAWLLTVEQNHRVLKILGALLCRIAIDADKKHDPLRELQRKAVYEYGEFLRDTHARQRFFEINDYMNQTYFKEFRTMRFQNPKGGGFGTE